MFPLFKQNPCNPLLVWGLIGCLIQAGCGHDWRKTQTSGQAPVPLFTDRQPAGTIADSNINEASGLAASINYPGSLWTTNDSGDSARVFLMGPHGERQAIFYLAPEGKHRNARDVEEIQVGPGPRHGVSYLYVGEIGDNEAQHTTSYIYRTEEPRIITDSTYWKVDITRIDTLCYRYPDGPRDAESFIVDPVSKDIFIFSKREAAHVYRAAYPQPTQGLMPLSQVATLPYCQLTAATISQDGSQVIVKNYAEVYYWQRKRGETLSQLFQRKATRLPYTPEYQGEGVAFALDSKGYYTCSESEKGAPNSLYYYSKLK